MVRVLEPSAPPAQGIKGFPIRAEVIPHFMLRVCDVLPRPSSSTYKQVQVNGKAVVVERAPHVDSVCDQPSVPGFAGVDDVGLTKGEFVTLLGSVEEKLTQTLRK